MLHMSDVLFKVAAQRSEATCHSDSSLLAVRLIQLQPKDPEALPVAEISYCERKFVKISHQRSQLGAPVSQCEQMSTVEFQVLQIGMKFLWSK